jgi:hypothetical protein
MRYEAPELVVLGPAPIVVLGTDIPGEDDNASSVTSRPEPGIALGLDD